MLKVEARSQGLLGVSVLYDTPIPAFMCLKLKLLVVISWEARVLIKAFCIIPLMGLTNFMSVPVKI
jgi:hypothetical protein